MEFKLINRDSKSFQKAVDKRTLTAICEKGLKTRVKSITELSSGLYNNTYIVETNNDKVILRVSPDKSVDIYLHEIYLMEREYNIQPYLSIISDVIPETIYVDFTKTIIDRNYIFQTYIEGDVWEEEKEKLTEKENDEIWFQVGQYAKQLSTVTSTQFGFPPPGKGYAKWSNFFISFAEGMRKDLLGFNIHYTIIDEFISLVQEYKPDIDIVKTPRLIHGDLWPRNILIKKKNGHYLITGILDSERAFWGDEIAEWIHYLHDVGDSYWDGYGKLYNDQALEIRRKIYRGVYLIQIILEFQNRFYKDDIKWALDGIKEVINYFKNKR